MISYFIGVYFFVNERCILEIIKRNGERVPFDVEKIRLAIEKAFMSVGRFDCYEETNELANTVVDTITNKFPTEHTVSVEEVQDLVELTLIDHKYHNVVRSYILYRAKHSLNRKVVQQFEEYISDSEIISIIKDIQDEFDRGVYDIDHMFLKFISFAKKGMSNYEYLGILIRASVELTSKEAPKWEFIAARFLRYKLKLDIQQQINRYEIIDFKSKIKHLEQAGLYGDYMREAYTDEEISELEAYIKDDRDRLFTYSALDLVIKRYLIRDGLGNVLETPQEMFMGIAMHLAIPENEGKLYWAKRIYDVISNLKATMATPTMSNARKPYHQLSSCFIDTVPDSLDGIYRSIDNFAKVSKHGGGMGLYFGKIRANGSAIRGFKGAAGGVVRWIKLANDTAVAVDQLGVRQGSVAVYLDVWHKDLPEFLQLKTNNGDDRMKAHDIFPAVCYPDLFWKLAKEDINANWYMMCPYEIRKVKGYSLEDSYGEEWERKYEECVKDPRIEKRIISVKDLVRLIIKSATETGTPFAFNRDSINRMNPNSHKGVIYSSNLCTEILQNMSPIESVSTEIETENGDTIVVNRTKAGEFVVCNLASLVLGNIDFEKDGELEDTISVIVRALDNVIDLNYYPVPYAQITNQKYRAIGVGTSGYHHAMVKKGIRWESEEHLDFADEIYERINYAVIDASTKLAEEKGSYAYFEGSDWQTGAYFEKRGYDSPEWLELKERVSKSGLRNAYLMAVAPTGSTSIIAGTTATIDPVMKKYFLEEKKGIITPRVAPELNPQTFWLYDNAHDVDQNWIIKAAAVRQRHIDQGQSLNLYITTDFTMRMILNLYIKACEEGIKTIYYIRSKSLEVEECESCSS